LRAARWFDFRKYEAALDRWAKVIGRAAPNPLIGKKLNPKFTEWLMGLPDGWVTDVEITSEQKIKACGNGVVPQQAKLALERLIS
jgi:DNA (cytosine-5)-methyltransferase 1